MQRRRLVVIGGNNVDIAATSFAPLVGGDSNPGRVHMGLGGVGRNIAENLTRLGHDVSLITAFGEDFFSEQILKQAKQIGLDCSRALTVHGGAGCVYICINDAGGDMAVAVNDMALCDRVTPEVLAERMDFINGADAAVLDANLTEETIFYLAEHCRVPLFTDAVSTAKAVRLVGALPRLYGVKANRIETETLTGVPIRKEGDLPRAAAVLHALGVRRVFITLGADGAFASDGAHHALMRPFPPPIRNATGCGDAFTAATVTATLDGESVSDTLATGLAAANVCGQSEEAVSPHMSNHALIDFLRNAQTKEEER